MVNAQVDAVASGQVNVLALSSLKNVMVDVGLVIPLPMTTLPVFYVVKLLLHQPQPQLLPQSTTAETLALLLTLLRVVDLASLLGRSSSLARVRMTESVPVGAVDSILANALVLSLLWNVMVDVGSVTRPPMTMLLAVFVDKQDARSSSGRPTEYNFIFYELMMGDADCQRVLGSACW